jgi:hypothetical protein
MNSFVRNIFGPESFTRNLVVSASGCFRFMPGFRLVTTGNGAAHIPLSVHNADTSPKPLADVGAAFYLLSLIASEKLATTRARGH